ncbi:unnamed protein product [Closterium sp. Naga37s-1]|nr:unnamed protein product [Closterium sp. Naga37s-1]
MPRHPCAFLRMKVVHPQHVGFLWLYPAPSKSVVDPLYVGEMRKMLSFLNRTGERERGWRLMGSFTVLNCYPFFLFKDRNGIVSYDYVLSRLKTRPSPMIPRFPSPSSHRLLHGAQLLPVLPVQGREWEALIPFPVPSPFLTIPCAPSSSFSPPLFPTSLHAVGEAGWPTGGNSAATLLNSKRWTTGFLARANSLRGTPKRPDMSIRAFLFELFDEDLKDTSRASLSCTLIPTASDVVVGGRVSWACWKGGGGLDCARVGSKCGAEMKATAVYNAWFQKQGQTSEACDFGGTAQVTMRNPSKGACQLHGRLLGVK